VFDPASKRFIELPAAIMIRRRLPPFVTAVALFRNASAQYVKETLEALAPAMAQFHGEETPEFCEGFGVPYLRAVPMKQAVDVAAFAKKHPNAAGLLLDAHAAGEGGGQGKTFDWRSVPRYLAVPVVLAGGLSPENVGAAIAQVQPFAVDVSSGIEATAGIKDHERMRRFMDAVMKADGR
jgi:phosphoribosylanthranilate isomerase